MKLTGKCLADFESWLKKQNDLAIALHIPNTMGGVVYYLNSNPNALPKRILNALIIDFFDSVGIYIQDWGLNVVDNNIGFDASVMYNFKNHTAQDDFSKKRQDAITEAIKKANEIYNQNY